MTTDERTDPHPSVVDELVAIVPRLVERTRSQAEFARSILGVLPCVGRLVPRRHDDPGPGVPEHERVDILSVLSDESADESPQAPSAAPPSPPAPTAEAAVDVPSEADLPIQDYDSLAASQVVPRLATLSAPELETIRSYEAGTRHRQTILNRVAQLLSD
jgi:hypothetical protein